MYSLISEYVKAKKLSVRLSGVLNLVPKQNIYDRLELETERKSDSGWATSYADMVTLLLCFFILFFNIEKASNDTSPDTSEDILVSIGKSFGTQSKSKDSESYARGSKTNQGSVAKSNDHFPEGERADSAQWIHGISKKIEKMKFVRAQVGKRQLALQFADVEFFKRGSYLLTSAGTAEVLKVFNVLKEHKHKLLIEIIGHSDSVPVSRRASGKFDSNVELSTLRALSVFKFLETRGMSRENMVIAGYSDSLPIEGVDAKNTVSAYQRRVSFKIHQK